MTFKTLIVTLLAVASVGALASPASATQVCTQFSNNGGGVYILRWGTTSCQMARATIYQASRHNWPSTMRVWSPKTHLTYTMRRARSETYPGYWFILYSGRGANGTTINAAAQVYS